MELRGILEETKGKYMERLKAIWYFEGFWQKFYLVLLQLISLYALIRVLIKGFW